MGYQLPFAEVGGRAGKRFAERPERRFYLRLALALGKTVKQLLSEVDSEEIAEWYAFDQRWPISDGWSQTARICRIIMAASGNFNRNDIPDEAVFIPSMKRPEQSQEQIVAELMKLTRLPGENSDASV